MRNTRGVLVPVVLLALLWGCGAPVAIAEWVVDARKENATPPRFVRPTDKDSAPSMPDATLLLFIHGIFGDTVETWKGSNNRYLWDYVVERPEFSRGFDAFAFGFVSNKIKQGSFDIGEAARTLRTEITNQQFLSRYKRVVIVAHSMGGLVAIRALLDSAELRAKVPVVVTYGAPYEGSQIALLADRVLNNGALKQMFPGGDYAQSLAKEWATLHQTAAPMPQILCAYEKLEIPGAGGVIVPKPTQKTFCDQNGDQPISGDHISMVKPDSDSHGSVGWLAYALQPLRPHPTSNYQDVLFDIDLVRNGAAIPSVEKTGLLSGRINEKTLGTNRLGDLVLRATAHVDPVTIGKPPLFDEARLVFYSELLITAQRVTPTSIQLDINSTEDTKIWNRSMELVQAGITAGHASGGKNILLCIKGKNGDGGAPFWGVDLGGIGWTAGAATRDGHYRIVQAPASFGGTDVRSVCEGYPWQ